ncbi:MAG TPA: hypothetical protein VEA78_04335, partial [Acidimicrobiales bacterium]|nr:hypothetical protein [Acidimicrobiales bacterium]
MPNGSVLWAQMPGRWSYQVARPDSLPVAAGGAGAAVVVVVVGFGFGAAVVVVVAGARFGAAV